HLEQANKALTKELEEVTSTLSRTEETLRAVKQQKTIYYDLMSTSANSLMTTVNGLLDVLKKVCSVQHEVLSLLYNKLTVTDCSVFVFQDQIGGSGLNAAGNQIQTSQTNGADD
ncbi:hypothetical protein GOODEAATRI_001315, partial [Goodea atripinnis]